MTESFKKNINNFFLGVNLTILTVICLCFFYWKDNIHKIIISHLYGKEECQGIIARYKMEKIYPNLFTARFYLLDEQTKMKEAEKFWEEKIYPLSSQLTPDERFKDKEELYKTIQRLNHVSSLMSQKESKDE